MTATPSTPPSTAPPASAAAPGPTPEPPSPVPDMLPFFCPIDSACHPQVDEVERRSLDWIDHIGMCATPAERAWAAGSNSADFYARFAPTADLDRLWPTAAWVYWGFSFDDGRCDEGELSRSPAGFAPMAARVQRALEIPGALHGDDRFAVSLHDLGERFRALATPVQVQRFVNRHRAWLWGVQWQIGDRARDAFPDLDGYLTMRLHSAGGEPTYAMLEIANGGEVPAREMDSPAVCALTEMAICVDALDNDRHSYAKEASRRQAEQNLFSVLMRQYGLTAEEAVRRGVALRDRVLCQFLRLRERILPHGSQELRRYLLDLGHGIRGNTEWALRAPRYLSLNGATAGPGEVPPPSPVPWADRPSDSRDQPPPAAPSVAWWWDDLTL
ncbi:glutamate dehydrogenase [Streptomyces sp. NPDC003077]|uniref:terpene synthase family protein n=1 Tax=Streptomyces sp. NPDC003077 TaxID=3154443 RepID=UPI0033A85FC8